MPILPPLPSKNVPLTSSQLIMLAPHPQLHSAEAGTSQSTTVANAIAISTQFSDSAELERSTTTSRALPLTTPIEGGVARPHSYRFTANRGTRVTGNQNHGRRGYGRLGRANYSTSDVSTLLDLVESVQPLGHNMWARVTEQFNVWATENERPPRDIDSLKAKYDKLASSTKPTGSALCPSPIRRAKKIQRQILGRAAGAALGDGHMSDVDEDREARGEQNDSNNISAHMNVVGAGARRRVPGAAGLKVKSSAAYQSDRLTSLMERMVESVSQMTSSMGDNNGDANSNTDAVRTIVRAEISSALSSTEQRVDELKKLVQELMNRIS